MCDLAGYTMNDRAHGAKTMSPGAAEKTMTVPGCQDGVRMKGSKVEGP